MILAAKKTSAIHREWPRLAISNGSLEALKWLALLLMTGDHINKYLFNGTIELLYIAGRMAMPIFVFILAYNLARPDAIERGIYKRTMKRLMVFGIIATPPFLALGGTIKTGWPLNILFTLLALTTILYLIEVRPMNTFVFAAITFIFAGSSVEFWWPALLLGVATWCYFKQPGFTPAVISLISLGSLWIINHNLWALGAIPLIMGAALIPIKFPRFRWAFYVYYPAHLFIIFLIRIPMSTAGYLFFT